MKLTRIYLMLVSIGIVWSFQILPLSAQSQYVPIKTQNIYTESTMRIGLLRQLLFSDAFGFDYGRLSVLIDGYQMEPRGRMRDGTVYLSPFISKDSEFLKLFVHELAHYIDIYSLVTTSTRDDISRDFYAISWQSSSVKKPGQGISSFVSGYAATNQYEDFAESLVMYVFHNATFSERGMLNESIRQKYLFFAKQVFSGGAFQGTDFSLGKVPNYLWDTTKVSFSLQKYLYSLQ